MNVQEIPQISTSSFDFSGGRLCLDFTNTLSDRSTGTPHEHLQGYQDLVVWSVQAHILTDGEAQRLLVQAKQHPEEAIQVYQYAVVLREAIFRIFYAVALDEPSSSADLALLNSALTTATSHMQLVQRSNHFVWEWTEWKDELDNMLWRVVRSAADTLSSDDIRGVKVCAADDCRWLFLDTSKNQSRRWCDMKSCGNRSKVRKHYERKKQPSMQNNDQ